MIVVRGIDPGAVSPGFRLAGGRGLSGFGNIRESIDRIEGEVAAASKRGDFAEAARLREVLNQLYEAEAQGAMGTPTAIRTQPTSPDAPGVRNMPAALIGGGVGDFLKNILGQGASAGQQFTSSIAALQAAEAQRERSRTLKLVGGGLLALAFVGGGIYAVSRLSKR